MSANYYQVAYEHATHEIAEIGPQIERLARRKQLLEKLLEPLKLLVPESDAIEMSGCYVIAYEHATNENAEIDEQIEKLKRRRQLLEKLLEPLQLLVPESDAVATPSAASGGLDTEFSAPEASMDESSVILVEVPDDPPDPLDASEPTTQQDLEEETIEEIDDEVDVTDVHARNGRRISDEDVAALAYRFWNERGESHGNHEEDWFRAMLELQESDH